MVLTLLLRDRKNALKSSYCILVIFLVDVISGASVSQSVTNFAEVACGQRSPGRGGRIVGGQDASPGEFPWLVSISKHGGHFCGGTLLTSQWVLTAAHCLCNTDILVQPSVLRVLVGGHDLRLPPVDSVSVRKFLVHPRYKCKKYENDIALLELAEPVEWSERVRPACLPSGYPLSSFSENNAVVAGWGWTSELTGQAAGGRANVLQKVELTVVDNQQCQSWYKSMGKKVKIHDTQMCAGFEHGGKDSCWADSGGPLMVEGDTTMVVGIVSTGIGCARARLPGLYTRVSDYVSWIGETLRR